MIPQRWIEAYLRFLLRRRLAVVIAVAVVTGFLGYALTGLQLRANFFDFYPRQHEYIRFYTEFRSMFGSANIMSVILEVTDGDIYTPETLQKLDRITKHMVYTRGVVPYQITSIAHPSVRGAVATAGGTITIREIFYPDMPKTQADAERVRFSVAMNPAVRGIYVANDDTAAVVHTAFWEEDLDFGDLYARMRQLKVAEEDGRHRIHITGFPWLYASIFRYVGELYAILAGTVVAMCFLLYVYFRTWTGIWVPLFSGLLSSIWGLAFAALLGFDLNPLMLVIPILLTARALSHSVQSMDRYHEEYAHLGDQQQAIVSSYSHLFAPAIASIITDGLALLIVAVTPIPLVQKMALFASFWIVSIFVSVVTLHPIILSYVGPPLSPATRAWLRPPEEATAGFATASILVAGLIVTGGVFGILAAVNEAVESSYWLNLAMIFVVIFLCVNLTYGSCTAAAILMIPVVLSQLAAEAVMVWMHIDLNVNSLPVAAVGAGVGIDYGIYHFGRMIDAYDDIGDLDLAVDTATATTGKAILFTASTMVAATIFWWLSALKFQAEMGMLLAVLMTFNTFGGLVVVPAFVKVIRPRFLLRRKRARAAVTAA